MFQAPGGGGVGQMPGMPNNMDMRQGMNGKSLFSVWPVFSKNYIYILYLYVYMYFVNILWMPVNTYQYVDFLLL